MAFGSVYFALHLPSLEILTAIILLCTVSVIWYLCNRNKRSFTSNVPPRKSAELFAFRKHYNDLQWAIQSPGVSAGILYAKGIIDEDVRDQAQLLCNTTVKSNQILLNAIEQAIKTHPHCFHQFMGILADEPTTESLHKRLQESYNMTNNTTGGCAPVHQQPCSSKETQTVMPFPQNLKISVPIHCATVKAIAKKHDDGEENIPKDGDEWLTLPVSILDTSSETPVPLPCVVALQGDEHIGPTGQVVCFLSLTVDAVEDDQPQSNTAANRNVGRMYYSERSGKNKYTPNGKATFRLCFFQANTNYIISLKIHSIYDEQGIECIGYTVDHYMGFISAVCTVERNAFKAPPLLKYEGPIATDKFRKLMLLYTKLFYQGRRDDSNMIMSRITSSGSTKLDVKLYMSMSRATEKPFDSHTIPQLEELFQKSQSLDSQNGFLLQALAMMCLSQMHVLQGRTDRALDCIHHSRSLCWEIAPSHLTSCVFFNDARILINKHKGNISPSIKRRILELFDRAIAHSYYGVGWERFMIFDTHYHKAMFCLNGVIDFCVKPESNYTPTEEDISLAEQHINAIPPDPVSTMNTYKVMYYTALSDLNRRKGNIKSARKYAEMAKQVCAEREYLTNLIASLETRLQLLQPDTIDEILEIYEDHI